MTTDLNSIATTTLIRRGGSIALSISYDFTDLDISILQQATLRSLISPAITQWWHGLTSSQRSVQAERNLNFKISGRYLK